MVWTLARIYHNTRMMNFDVAAHHCSILLVTSDDGMAALPYISQYPTGCSPINA